MTVIDTCSLLNFVRYYLPFDKDSILFNFIKTRVESGEFVIIDKVYKQCSYTAQGLVIETLPFLKEHQTKTIDLLPDRKFFHWLENDFKNHQNCKNLTAAEFENEKRKFTEDADVKMLLYCEKYKNSLLPPRILTDETGVNNDNKYFKKLPSLCETMGIGVVDIATFFKEHDLIDIKVKEL